MLTVWLKSLYIHSPPLFRPTEFQRSPHRCSHSAFNYLFVSKRKKILGKAESYTMAPGKARHHQILEILNFSNTWSSLVKL